MITSTLTTAEEIYEIVSFEFKDGVPLSTQQESMEILNRLVAASKGLKSRQFYYSSKDNRWIDIVVWDSEENAAAAAAHVMNWLIAFNLPPNCRTNLPAVANPSDHSLQLTYHLNQNSTLIAKP